MFATTWFVEFHIQIIAIPILWILKTRKSIVDTTDGGGCMMVAHFHIDKVPDTG